MGISDNDIVKSGNSSISLIDPHYSMVEPVLTYSTTTSSNDTVSGVLEDRSMNLVTIGSNITKAVFTFPPRVTGKARDFILRATLTGETLPTIEFHETNGQDISFDSEDDSWADIKQGVNIFSFTDTGIESI